MEGNREKLRLQNLCWFNKGLLKRLNNLEIWAVQSFFSAAVTPTKLRDVNHRKYEWNRLFLKEPLQRNIRVDACFHSWAQLFLLSLCKCSIFIFRQRIENYECNKQQQIKRERKREKVCLSTIHNCSVDTFSYFGANDKLHKGLNHEKATVIWVWIHTKHLIVSILKRKSHVFILCI